MTRSTVLIVDDESLIRWSLREQLQGEGLQILEARDRREALHQARRRPDVVLLDYRLPDSDGLQVAQDLLRRHPRLPILLMSAELDGPLEEAARGIGCAGCLAKPFHLEEVGRRVLALLDPNGGTVDPSSTNALAGVGSRR